MKDKLIKIKNKKIIDNIKEISESCIECKICVKECPMLQNYSESPKNLFDQIVENKEVDPIVPYSCNTCDSCMAVCPKNLNISKAFMDIRKEIVKNNKGVSPLKGHNSVHMHQKLSFSKFFSGVIKDSNSKSIKRLFMPGCSLCSYSPELVFKTFEYLKEKLPGTAMIIECCGKPTKALGEEEHFKERYKKLQDIISSTGAEEIITACQSCFLTLSENSQDQEVKSLWKVFDEIGVPERAKAIGKNSNLTFSIHDSCPTRNRGDIQDAVRKIIRKMEYKVEEMEHSRDNTRCCGTGGMVLTVNPKISLAVMKNTASNSNSDYIVTYCASCRESMTTVGKKSLHILDLIFGDIWTSESQIPKATGLFKNWKNRYKVKKGGI